MVALEQLKRIREMAINKMNEIIRVAEGKFEAKEEFPLEPKEEKEPEAVEVAEVAEAEEAVTEVSEVPPKPRATKTRHGEKGGINRSALIRDYFEKHEGVKNSEVIEYMRKVHKLDVKPSLVSTVKTHMPKAGKKKSERKAVGAKRGRKAKGGLPMVACVTRVLAKSKSKHGAKAEDILEGVKKLGYVYSGNKGEAGFLNCVYQALHELSKEKSRGKWKGSTPVLLHDKEEHTWRLNPKAERKSA